MIGGVGVRLNDGDLRVSKYHSEKCADHCSTESLIELMLIGKKLIHAACARVAFILPPSIPRAHDDVGLNESDRLMVSLRYERLGRRSSRRQIVLLDISDADRGIPHSAM
jgi:hypothetical protein